MKILKSVNRCFCLAILAEEVQNNSYRVSVTYCPCFTFTLPLSHMSAYVEFGTTHDHITLDPHADQVMFIQVANTFASVLRESFAQCALSMVCFHVVLSWCCTHLHCVRWSISLRLLACSSVAPVSGSGKSSV